MADFQNQIVVVTGAGSGIGKAAAEAFAEKGASVVVAELNPETGEETACSIREKGGKASFIETDVRKPNHIIRLFQETEKQFGSVHVLINNAGISRWKDPLELDVAEWEDVIHTNLRSVFLCSREAAKYMKKQGTGGAIVNIASTRAFMSEPYTEAYAASKGGIVALTHALAISFGRYRIRVNSISPGWIETKHYDQLSETDHAQHPAGRVGRPRDIAKGCLYLADRENGFITGQNLTIDGGMTVKMIYEE
ncbi:putative oxidoreductase [Weizmannia acidilactici]|uniref:Oxidoreductase n=1 Tax=Weizmannia acidilactici TaxID=2607726 RepID=A0A5J4J1K8_9BACI|nr:glucose 1-dehydrogenase [Weizmannia acidilactici]GER67715.1 putative oxidoreductase [Weizmannia acidilactici]GER68952.1 putative oxidoreductase [Weizmannia acidilactici]GER73867.1 putative oxidoreductase [Weizmannia acidilactici]